MNIKSITLKNIRAISNLQISLEGAELPQHSIIIGGNSTCKTTILRCISLGLCDEANAGALLTELPGSLIGDREDTATIEIALDASEPAGEEVTIVTKLSRKTLKRLKGKRSSAKEDEITDRRYHGKNGEAINFDHQNIFVCGYGSGRGSIGAESYQRYRTVDSVYTLFRYDQALQNTELILHRLRDYRSEIYHATRKNLLRMMNLKPSDRIELTHEGILVSGTRIGKNIPFESLADGYRSTAAWICDMIGWAMLGGTLNEKGKVSGILLVDEIEQHLHPSLQMEFLPSLRKLFPNLQLITATHSPIIALTAMENGLFALKRRGGRVYLLPPVDGISYFTAQDVYEDDHLFDVDAQAKTLTNNLERYHVLGGIPASRRTAAQQKELVKLARELGESGRASDDESQLLSELSKLRKSMGL